MYFKLKFGFSYYWPATVAVFAVQSLGLEKFTFLTSTSEGHRSKWVYKWSYLILTFRFTSRLLAPQKLLLPLSWVNDGFIELLHLLFPLNILSKTILLKS